MMFEFTTIFFMIGNVYMVVNNEKYMLILTYKRTVYMTVFLRNENKT